MRETMPRLLQIWVGVLCSLLTCGLIVGAASGWYLGKAVTVDHGRFVMGHGRSVEEIDQYIGATLLAVQYACVILFALCMGVGLAVGRRYGCARLDRLEALGLVSAHFRRLVSVLLVLVMTVPILASVLRVMLG